MNYIDEDELKSEIIKVQKQQKLKKLYNEKAELENLAHYHYNWEKIKLTEIIQEIKEIEDNGGDVNYKLDHFGEMIMLMMKKIATKNNYSGYTWQDEFFSDATIKILKYLHNFNPDMISKISGKKVKAFAYITQIIMNSFIFIINKHKKDKELINKLIPISEFANTDRANLYLQNSREETIEEETVKYDIVLDFSDSLTDTFSYNGKVYNNLLELLQDNSLKSASICLNKSYVIQLEEYNSIINLKLNPLNIWRKVPKNSFPQKKRTRFTMEEQWDSNFDEIEGVVPDKDIKDIKDTNE